MLIEVSKLAWWLVKPSHLLPLALAAGIFCLWKKRRRCGWTLLGSSATILLLASLTPIPFMLLQAMERETSPPEVLPADIHGVVLLNVGGDTVKEFIALSRRYPAAKLAVSGGQGTLAHATEAGEFRLIAAAQGLDPKRLILEDRSRNTYENAVFTHALVRPKPDERWILITTAHHMPRALRVFRKAGWNVIPFPVSYGERPVNWIQGEAGIRMLETVAYERLALASYWLTGRI